jgi:hypothetical protein
LITFSSIGAFATTGTDQELVRKIDYINPGGGEKGEYDDHESGNYIDPPWEEGTYVETYRT